MTTTSKRLLQSICIILSSLALAAQSVAQRVNAKSKHNDSLLTVLSSRSFSPEEKVQLVADFNEEMFFTDNDLAERKRYLDLVKEVYPVAERNHNIPQLIEFKMAEFFNLPDTANFSVDPLVDSIKQMISSLPKPLRDHNRYLGRIGVRYGKNKRIAKYLETEHFQMELAQRNNNQRSYTFQTLNLCGIYIQYNCPDIALSYLHDVKPYMDTCTTASLKRNYASRYYEIYTAKNKPDSAQHWIRVALNNAAFKGNETDGTLLTKMASNFEQTGRLDSAAVYLYKARLYADSFVLKEQQVNARMDLSEFYLRQGALDSADFHARQALNLARNYDLGLGRANWVMGNSMYRSGKYAAAMPPLITADSIFSITPFLRIQRLEVLHLLAQIQERLGNWKEALRYTKEEEKIRDETAKDNDASIAAQSEVKEAEMRYQQHVDNLNDQNQQQKRFALFWGIAALVCLGFLIFALMQLRAKRRLLGELSKEKLKSEALLLNVLPTEIASRLKTGEQSIADYFDEASVIFIDIVGFTALSARHTPARLLNLLNDIFTRFDQLIDQFELEKIKTIGDCYMAVAGVPNPSPDHLKNTIELGLTILSEMEAFHVEEERIRFRIGIETGPLVAGIIGEKRFIYDLWGDTVNTASRMESHGIPSTIHTTQRVYEKMKDQYQFEARGPQDIKGKGVMETYLLSAPVLVD